MIRAVIVDVDDTLIMTEAASFALENEVLARLGRTPMPRDAHLSTWGLPLLDAIRRRSPGVDVDRFAAVFPSVFAGYVADGRIDAVAAENVAALDHLAAAGYRVMALTSRTHAEVRHLLAPEHPLAARLTATYHLGATRHAKPDPRVFDELLADTGLEPRQCVYVGDSPGDAHAANGAGLRFIACLQSGHRRRDHFDGHRVDRFIEAFPDIGRAVAQLDDCLPNTVGP